MGGNPSRRVVKHHPPAINSPRRSDRNSTRYPFVAARSASLAALSKGGVSCRCCHSEHCGSSRDRASHSGAGSCCPPLSPCAVQSVYTPHVVTAHRRTPTGMTALAGARSGAPRSTSIAAISRCVRLIGRKRLERRDRSDSVVRRIGCLCLAMRERSGGRSDQSELLIWISLPDRIEN